MSKADKKGTANPDHPERDDKRITHGTKKKSEDKRSELEKKVDERNEKKDKNRGAN